MSWQRILKHAANRSVQPTGAEIVGTWEIDWRIRRTFTLNGRELPYFYHAHNCGWPPRRCTERIVELAVADFWLARVVAEQVLEIGAVTPYYWPRRIPCVIDPADPHGLVTHRRSLFDFDLTNRIVLSLSTIEHVGTGEYGIDERLCPIDALRKVCSESSQCLITFPTGCDDTLDAVSMQDNTLGPDVSLFILVREGCASWRQESNKGCRVPKYGPKWANGLIVVEKGGLLSETGLNDE